MSSRIAHPGCGHRTNWRYTAIGFDHFAQPDDSLAVAAREGRLHRNFQGYTADAGAVLIGFGASAIGRLPQGYVQNTVATGVHQQQVAARGMAVARGAAFNGRPDHFQRSWIKQALKAEPVNLRIMHVEDDSMIPTLRDGDVVLVDTGRRAPTPPGIFVLRREFRSWSRGGANPMAL